MVFTHGYPHPGVTASFPSPGAARSIDMGEQTHIIRRPDQLSIGRTDAEIRQACASGTWARIHRGAYVDSGHLSRLDAYGRHRLRAEAVACAASPGATVSHVSAAVLHGFELWNTPLDVVHLSRNRRGGGRESPLDVMCTRHGWRTTRSPKSMGCASRLRHELLRISRGQSLSNRLSSWVIQRCTVQG